MIDFSLLVMLRELRVGDGSFKRVNKVNLVSLHQLERVVIGEKCFTEKEECCDVFDREYRGRFYLKDCEKVRELIVGCYSFSNYSVCEIANVPSLEVIEIGVLEDDNISFESAAFDSGKKLELKSIHRRMSLMHRLAQVEIRSLWLLRVSLLFTGCV